MINILEKQFLNTEYQKPEAEDWHKDLAYKKFEYQKQKDNEKYQRELLLKRQENAEQIGKAIGTALRITFKGIVILMKLAMYCITIPLSIIALFFGGFVGGMIKLK